MPDNQPSTPDSIARTPDGSIANQGQTTTPAATTPQTSTTPETESLTASTTGTQEKGEEKSLINQEGKSLANQAPETQAGAPETYATFNVPEGWEMDEATAKEIGPMFKAMNLTQADAQKLVDFYVAKTTESQNAPFQLWQETQEKWVKEVKNDPTLGPRLNEVKQTISRAIDTLNDPKLANEFRMAMDYTGAGNNPAFIRAFWKLSQMVTEGRHVAGNGPSPAGQQQRGTVPSAARAMYPNLP